MTASLLLLDVGNSATKMAIARGGAIKLCDRLVHARVDSSHEVADHIERLVVDNEVARAGLVSVVPARSREIRDALSGFPDVGVFEVSSTCRLPFEMGYESPDTLGLDRLAAATAAWTAAWRSGKHVISIDAGTAVTFDVVHRDGIFLGGPIAPGPDLLARASRSGTATLPEVSRSLPERIVARNTSEALQAGIMYGFIESVSGIVRRLRAELAGPATVVATGGWGPLLRQHSNGIDRIEPHLVLLGVQHLMQLNP
jgi:type III pantothenate kinase